MAEYQYHFEFAFNYFTCLLLFRKGKEDDFPESYKTNTEKEKMILSCCENFRRQFVHLFRDRKPLLLCPMNEAGVQVRMM